MSEAGWRFVRVYGDGKVWLFRDGRLVCDVRASGRAWRVRQFYPDSMDVYRQTLCSSERVARRVAVELAETMGSQEDADA